MSMDSEQVDIEIYILPPPHPLDEKDMELFRLVEAGLVEAVSSLFKSTSYGGDYNDKIDEHGNMIWHIAIHRKDEEMLRELLKLSKVTHLYDLLLHAIEEQRIKLIKMVLEEIRVRHPDIAIPSQLSRWKYSKYSKDITPIILSALKGNYNLIKFFYEIGEDFTPIYSETRVSAEPEDYLGMSTNRMRLHEYQTKASPAMLCYRTHTEQHFDPVLQGFRLISELKRVGEEEHEFYDEYKRIREILRNFLGQLLDECRSTSEMTLLLVQRDGYEGSQDKYPRLMMAIDNKFYKFVTHQHCQKMLYMHWAGDCWPDWRARGSRWKCFQITKRFFFAPFICLWLYIDFFSNRGKFFLTPVNIWIHHFVSYLYFMLILGIEAYLLSREEHANVHNTPCKPLEVLIILFVLGNLVSVVVHILAAPKTYLCVAWYWYDLITLKFFFLTFGFWFITWHTQRTDPITKPRTHWIYYDSVLCGEAMFAVSTVLAYGKFMRYFQLSYKTGPLQIAMANMIQDISIFVFFFAVIMLSFGMGLYFLYSPFRGVYFTVSGHEYKMADSFTTFSEAIHTLYWGTLSMGVPESAEITILGENETEKASLIRNNNCVHLTEMVGTALWMFYHLLGPMILMNMLTGYMGNTFIRIEENMDATWKYNRSQVWVYYMRNTVLPAPFNLIPTLGQIFKCYACITTRRNKKNDTIKEEQHNQKEELTISNQRVLYNSLVKVLTQRYLRSKSYTAIAVNANDVKVARRKDVQNILSRVAKLKCELRSAKKVHQIGLTEKKEL